MPQQFPPSVDATLDHTRKVFQKRTARRLSDEDCREIRENLVGFFALLAEWDQKDRAKKAVAGREGRRDG